MVKRILIVDDSASWRRFNVAALNLILLDGYECVTADSGREGLEVVLANKDTPFDIIISDLQMELDFEPESAGEWFVRQVKSLRECNGTKIIIVSAMYNIEHVAKNLGVNFLRKSTLANDILSLKLKLEEI